MTVLLIAANVACFLWELSLPPKLLQRAVFAFGVIPARFWDPGLLEGASSPLGSSLSLFTSMFLHGGWLHLVGNMWSLWIFGDNVEDRMGRIRFLVFYLLVGIAAGVTHVFANPGSTLPTVGASGAIAGVMGGYFLMFPRSRILMVLPIFFYPLFFEMPALLFLGYWFFVQIFSGTLSLAGPANAGGVAWWAHGGGFVAGVVLHRLFVRRDRTEPPSL
jgi:rhomboid family protein